MVWASVVPVLCLFSIAHRCECFNPFLSPNQEKHCAKELKDTKMSSNPGCSAVMVYEEPLFLKPFRQETRSFTLSGQLINIHQMWEELGVAAVVWDAAIVLSEFLEREVSAGRMKVKNQRIIELGAGTGLVSIAVALLEGRIVSTDRESTLNILNRNIQENLKGSLASLQDLVTVRRLDWGENLQDYEEPFDLILGADIIYIEKTFDKLLTTVRHLTSKSSRILLSCRIRYDRDLHFLDLLKEFYQVSKIFIDKEKGIDIYEATLLH